MRARGQKKHVFAQTHRPQNQQPRQQPHTNQIETIRTKPEQ